MRLFLIGNKVEMRLSKPLMKSQDANTQSVSKIPTCFSDTYSADTSTASMRKLAPVARTAEAAGYVTLHDPGLVERDKLRSLHDPDYVHAFITGEGLLASSQGWGWTPQIRNGVLAINAGQIVAADMAFKHGIAANVAQGFHHAQPERGSGFCTPPPNAQGGALLANVPANPREELDAATKTEEAHRIKDSQG
jgi:hypothetical protein